MYSITHIFKAPLRLHNPVALTAIAVVCLARGAGYVIVPVSPEWLDSSTAGPGIPWLPIWVAGAAWITGGVVVIAALFKRALLNLSLSYVCALYIVWALINVLDLFVSPDISSIISIVSYAVMVPIVLTLGQMEIIKEAEYAGLSSHEIK